MLGLVISNHGFWWSVIKGTDAIFLCLATPPNLDGSTDLSYYKSAANTLGELLSKRRNPKRVVIVNKSTVPIGTARLLQGIFNDHGVKNFGVASNPEFLPEGNAVEMSRKPDRVVIGADEEEDFAIIRRIYPQFVNHVRIRYIETTPETAESIKYVANTLLLTYISYWNGVGGRLCETFDNIRMEHLKMGVTADARISTWGSYVSNGAGGSCFGKDIQSLTYQLSRAGQATDLLQSVYKINEYQKTYLVDRAIYEAGFNFNRKTVALLGLSFKKRTNDMRDSSALKVVEALLDDWLDKLQPYYDDWSQTRAGTFSEHLIGNSEQVAEDLLTVTDVRADNTSHKTAAKAYRKMRPSAKNNVIEAVPGLARLIEGHMPADWL